MKSITLSLILMFLILGVSSSQQTEDFEDETHGTTTFTLNGANFITTGDLLVGQYTGQGCNQSDKYLDTGWADGGSSGSFGSIRMSNRSDRFTVSTSMPWCMLLSHTDGDNFFSGHMKILGTLTNGQSIEETFKIIKTPEIFDNFIFSPEIWENQELTSLEFIQVEPVINYLAIDNIVFDNLVTTHIVEKEEEELIIFPNPAIDKIKISGIENIDLKIIDAYGKIIREQSAPNQEIDITDLSNGIYFISFHTQNGQINRRIVKQ